MSDRPPMTRSVNPRHSVPRAERPLRSEKSSISSVSSAMAIPDKSNRPAMLLQEINECILWESLRASCETNPDCIAGSLRYYESCLNQAFCMKRDQIDFPVRHEALREDVSLLGGLIGELLQEQCGESLFLRVEEARSAAIDRRSGKASGAFLQSLCRFEDSREASDFIRGFAAWFRMVNLAEQVHRIRRRREYQKSATRPQ